MKLTSILIHLLLGVGLASLAVPAAAQRAAETEDVLHLNDGSILRGEATTRPDGRIAVRIYGGSVFVVDPEDIAYRTVDRAFKPSVKVIRSRRSFEAERIYAQKFYGYGQLTFIAGSPNSFGVESWSKGGILASSGYRWHHALATGLGVALEGYDRGSMLPVFAEVRGDVFPTQVTLHYYARGGYNFPTWPVPPETRWQVDNTRSGKPLLDVGIGLKVNTHGRTGFLFAVGYRQTGYKEGFSRPLSGEIGEDRFNREDLNFTMRRATFQLGVLF